MREINGRPGVGASDKRKGAIEAAGGQVTSKGRARRNGSPSIIAPPGATPPAPPDPWDDGRVDPPFDGAPFEDHPDRQDGSLVTSRQVRARIGGISAMCLWRWIRDGKFPVPIKINGRNYWPEGEVRGWVAARSARKPHDVVAPDAQSC